MKKFITFEGGEGSGKSTQSKLLSKSLQKINEKNFLTREPGGTEVSEKIRNLLVRKSKIDLLPETELLLIYAARHEHVKKKIIPNLKKKIVICDRYFHSTYCYQILANKVSEKKLKFLHKSFAYNLFPDLTIFLNLEPKIGIQRSLKKNKIENRFELKNIRFHTKIKNGFIKLSKNNPHYIGIDANATKIKIHHKIIDFLNRKKITKNKIPYSL